MWLQKLSIQSKLSIIIGLIVFLLLFGLAEFMFGMKVMSSIRAYVGGEGLWSKGQKEAMSSLIKYSQSFDEPDYQAFLHQLQVPLGDHQARIELEKSEPNYTLVSQGFIQGGNDPADVDDLIFLYRRFRHVSYMDRAIETWTEGDAGIQDMLQVGQELHVVVLTSRGADQAALSAQLAPLTRRLYSTDQQLTILENRFSATLGEGSRAIRNILFWVTVLGTLIFGSFALLVVLFIRKILIEVDMAKSTFVLLASHQLRTPATNMKWFLEMLSDGEVGKLNEKQKEYIDEVSRNNERLIVLMNALLNVSRVELGVFDAVPGPIDMRGAIQKVLKEQKAFIEQKHLDITESFEPNLPSMLAEENLLTIVMQNIISNAIKYTPENGSIHINVIVQRNSTARDRRLKGEHIIVSVADTGYGIPADQHGKVFTRFFRGDNVRAQDTDGSGLGLYMTRLIMDHLKGDIWFDSKVGAGTTFFVAFPIRRSEG